jgi:hypothetical protein
VTKRRLLVATAFVCIACRRESRVTQTPPASRGATADAHVSASTRDASRDGRDVAPSRAVVAFSGTAEGRGAEPPIHEFAPRAGADAWHGSGAVQLQIESDGAVRGSITMSGLALAVTGRRVGDRIVATLAQVVGADSAPIAIEGIDAGPPEGLFRGALDADVSGGNTIRGSWEASAGAGVHRRRGTLEAHAAR